MAKKKRHINGPSDLEQALRIVGGIFPHTIDELNLTCKLVGEEKINEIKSELSFDEIWNAAGPRQNNIKAKIITNDFQSQLNDSCGMAARGNNEIPNDVWQQMINNEKRNKKKNDQ